MNLIMISPSGHAVLIAKKATSELKYTREAIMKKILVVDDEANIRELYREELEDMGYEVTTVADGAEALAALDTAKFDLVTLDMRMPDIDGIETLRKMKEKDNTLPIVICTAYEEYKHDFGSWCSDAYVVKSADTSLLRETIKKILG
jgi:two-component system response regulator (stage 0 sporulation protein F)